MLTLITLLILIIVVYFVVRRLRRQRAIIKTLNSKLKQCSARESNKDSLFNWLRKE